MGKSLIVIGLFLATLGYFYYLGEDVQSIGKLQGPGDSIKAVGLIYQSPEDFGIKLLSTFNQQDNSGKKIHENTRRLSFKCVDGSESFQVFRTTLGVLAIPNKSIKCDDGSYLLSYSKK